MSESDLDKQNNYLAVLKAYVITDLRIKIVLSSMLMSILKGIIFAIRGTNNYLNMSNKLSSVMVSNTGLHSVTSKYSLYFIDVQFLRFWRTV